MAIKKSELYSSLWKSCDELRGGMDASQYKDYVLVLLFMKYISDKYAGQKNALLDVPEGGRFEDMVALKGTKEIGDQMNKIIGKLADANELSGVITVADFNDETKLGTAKEMVDRLTKLIAIFEGLDFSRNRAGGDDLLGDAYEFLMRHFATESGKSKGQFYTPAEVSRVMAQVIGLGGATSNQQTIYDPTCGSGALLLKAHDEAKSKTGFDLALYGQEMDNATAGLARMNTILHNCPTAVIHKDNSLARPHFKDKHTGDLLTFDFVVANPPFSNKAWRTGVNPEDPLTKRFEVGKPQASPPDKNGDYAFLLHILASLKSTGKGAVILPHGVLFRGNAEAELRRYVVRRGYIKGIIGLPANLFYGTGIPACILVLDKEGAPGRRGIFMIDASRGFLKDGNKNRLRAQDIHRIVDTLLEQREIEKYSRMVPLKEIEGNDYNLNLPRYIDSSEPEDLQDIDAHLNGGIPTRDLDALSRYWEVFPSVRARLYTSSRPGYSALMLPVGEVKEAIFSHPEFAAFQSQAGALFAGWRDAHRGRLKGIAKSDDPKALIATLSEDLLTRFGGAPLVDPYAVYQHLMDYWDASMHDDAFLVTQEGWREAARPRPVDVRLKEQPDFVIGGVKLVADLVPPGLVVARYFAKEQALLETLEAKAEELGREKEEYEEEHGGEDGLLEDARSDSGKLTAASVKARHREIKHDPTARTERQTLERYLELLADEADAGRVAKEFRRALELKVAKKYDALSEEEIQALVVDDKWLTALESAIQAEQDSISQALTTRIKTLANRYETPLPRLTEEISALEARVGEHLKKMGFAWN